MWEETYNLAKIYFVTYGNLEIPISFKTFNGKDYDENGTLLGKWIHRQRCSKKNKTLSQERETMLERIGMRFDNKNLLWEEMYALAKIYYETNGDLEIKSSFKTFNGKDYSENGITLGIWINNQRYSKKNKTLLQERETLLLQIGMRFDNKNLSWEETYYLAKIYYETYGNLEIPQKYKTNNGKDYDENGFALGQWISNQRQLKKNKTLSQERETMLERIRMIWDTRKNKSNIEKICNDYNMDYKKYKKSLDSLVVEELMAKLQYLTNHNIPIIDNNGNLNNIIFMSRINLQVEYGIDIVDLINENIEKNKEK